MLLKQIFCLSFKLAVGLAYDLKEAENILRSLYEYSGDETMVKQIGLTLSRFMKEQEGNDEMGVDLRYDMKTLFEIEIDQP